MAARAEQKDNEIFLDAEGFVRFIYVGDQDEMSIREAISRGMKIIERPRSENKLYDILVDIRKIGKHTPASRRVALEVFNTLPFRKMAIIISKTDPYTAKIAKIMISISFRKKEISLFKTEPRAIKWLKN